MPKKNWQIKYAEEFVKRYGELSYGQRHLVDDSIRKLLSSDDPTLFAHHLERASYFCNWSYRARANLLLVFGISKRKMVFLSTGTHSQAYHPS